MDAAAQQGGSRPDQHRTGPGVVNVLFVDDDPAFLRLACTALQDKPMAIRTAETGHAALEQLDDGSVDCIVSDVSMVGVDGFELCIQAKRRHPGIPFLLLTGHVDARTRHRAGQVGADACLQKGMGLDAFDALADRIHRHVERARVPTTHALDAPHAHNAIAVHDPDTGELLGANTRYIELLGSAAEPAPGGPTTTYARGSVERIRQEIREEPDAPTRAVSWAQECSGGQQRQLEGIFERVTIDGQTRVLVTIRDVTGREDQGEMIQAIYGIVADRTLSFPEKVDALMTLGRRVLGTGFATLSRMRGDEYIFEHVQSPRGEIEPGDAVSLDETLCEQAVLNNQTLVVESPFEAVALNRGATLQLACYVGAPVYIGERVHGTFCFYDVDPREEGFTDWEVTLVEMMSQWLSLEMERDTAEHELQREN